MRKLDPALQEMLKKTIFSMGYEMVGGEVLPQGGRLTLRIYIDNEKGVSVDDCSLVSRQVSAVLDVEDSFQGRYNLEVSSPGIDRPMFELEHYQKYQGSRIKLRLHAPLDGKRQLIGTLVRVVGEEITVLLDGAAQEVAVPFSLIEKAHLIGEVRL
jgi:ribosome maturation factor RimP